MIETADMTKPIVRSFFVQEEDPYKVLVHLRIPELKLKRSFPNFLKFVPSNGHVKVLEFRNQSFTFMINIQNKLYSISIARLPGEIQPKYCSVKYQRDGCRITLIKLKPTFWMNRICDEYRPELDTQEGTDQSLLSTGSAEAVSLKDTDIPPLFNLVTLTPSLASLSKTKRRLAPPLSLPSLNIMPLASSLSFLPKTKKRPAPQTN